jgi:hypothetical protein
MGKACPVKILLVGICANIDRLVGEVKAADLAVERWPEGAASADTAQEIAAIASDLRRFESALGSAEGPDGIVVASDSSASLAAVLVATKLGTPVACLDASGEDPVGTNALLIRQLADAELAAESAAIVDWMRDTYTDRACR